MRGKKAQVFELILLVIGIIIALFLGAGIYNWFSSPMIQWGLLIALVIFLLANKKVQSVIKKFIRF